ncbi:MAG: hypothetical protein IJL92_08895 [Thermoguttaceae bacterium]|nr:hypothetical protein [Thermoguttaceae bacterium]
MCEAESTTEPTLDILKKELNEGIIFPLKHTVVDGAFGLTRVYDPDWCTMNGGRLTCIDLLTACGFYGRMMSVEAADGLKRRMVYRVPYESQDKDEWSQRIEKLARILTQLHFFSDFLCFAQAANAKKETP